MYNINVHFFSKIYRAKPGTFRYLIILKTVLGIVAAKTELHGYSKKVLSIHLDEVLWTFTVNNSTFFAPFHVLTAYIIYNIKF